MEARIRRSNLRKGGNRRWTYIGRQHQEAFSHGLSIRNGLYFPLDTRTNATEPSELYCVQNPPVTQYSAHFYHRLRLAEWRANEILPDGNPNRNVIPPHDPAVFEDRKNVYIESMAELEKTFLAFDSIIYTARFGARYHRMRDPRVTPGNKNDREMVYLHMFPNS